MKGIGLLSGGLDSAIAVYLMKEQGVDIVGINIDTGFISEDLEKLEKLSERFNFRVERIDVFEEYKKILDNPRFGFGKNMNPCIDCRILMYRVAKKKMQEEKADFIFTGEVLGQRPFSQTLYAVKQIEEKSDTAGMVIRPLSAFYFRPTGVELSGRINRSKFLSIKGRNRKVQLKLAELWKLNEFNSPSGGCLLTDPGFSRKLKEWIRIAGGATNLTREMVEIMKIGRHIKLSDRSILVVGRNRSENSRLEEMSGNYVTLKTMEFPGPTAIIFGDLTEREIRHASEIVARYSDAPAGGEVRVKVMDQEGKNSFVRIKVDKKLKYSIIT